MAFWDLHAAWFYRQLSVIGEWGSGFQDYALVSNLQARTNLPVQSFYVQAGYFLTGETASSVGIVKPLRPFDLRKGHFGLGAFELTGRYAYMDIGREVFTNGLADRQSLDEPALPDRRRPQLAPDPVPQGVSGLAARRFRQPGPVRPRPPPD